MSYLVLGLGWLKSALSAALDLARRHPWQCACLALLAASLWLWHGRNEARAERDALIAAQEEAKGAQKRLNDAVQAHYTEKADEADERHIAARDDARDATADFIARNRVRPQDRTCGAPAPASGDGADVPPEVPSGVVVGQADVRACADLYAYAVSAHDWAQSLKVPENLLPAP